MGKTTKTTTVKSRIRPATKRRSSTVQSVQHAIEVLRCVSQVQPEISVSEIARARVSEAAPAG